MIPAALLPPVQAPPHDPRAMALRSENAWGKAALKDLHIDATSNALLLDASAQLQRFLTEITGTFGGLVLPTTVTVTPGGDVFLVDSRRGRLLRFDPCECRFDVVPCFPEKKDQDAGKHRLSGIGYCEGNLYICDAAPQNPRLIVLSLRSFAPRGLWQPPRSAYTGSAPKLATTWSPFDVDFDGRGRVYVSDSANGCIHRFSPRGTWLGCFPNLGRVTHLAMDCKDRLYALVENTTLIKVVDTRTGVVSDIHADSPGTSRPPDSTPRWVRPEDLALLFPQPAIQIDRTGRLHLGSLCPPQNAGSECSCETDNESERGVFDLNGDPVQIGKTRGPVYRNKGMLTTSELDSGIYRCTWHRVVLIGNIPPGTTVEVASFTSEIILSADEISSIFDNRQLTRSVVVRAGAGRISDALIQSDPGRYLWLRLVFSSDGQTSPAIEYAEIEFPRISLRRYLPAAFGEERVSADFTDRFLALFDTTHRSVETKIDNFARYFDPASTTADRRGGKTDFLSWLASWVGITFDRQWPEERRRRFLKQAGKLFPLRGTRPGLWSQLLIYLGMEQSRVCCERSKPRTRCVPAPYNCEPIVAEPCSWEPPPLILEHFKLRRWLFVGMGRLHDQAMLWGRRIVNRSQLGDQHAQLGETQLIKRQDPLRDPFHYYAHQFSVFIPARFGKDDRERKGLENLLKAESPAHTKWTIHYVEPRFRIGFQSMIGLDAVVGRYPIGVRMDEARLGGGTVLSSPPRDAGKPAFRVGDATRIGNSTTLN